MVRSDEEVFTENDPGTRCARGPAVVLSVSGRPVQGRGVHQSVQLVQQRRQERRPVRGEKTKKNEKRKNARKEKLF